VRILKFQGPDQLSLFYPRGRFFSLSDRSPLPVEATWGLGMGLWGVFEGFVWSFFFLVLFFWGFFFFFGLWWGFEEVLEGVFVCFFCGVFFFFFEFFFFEFFLGWVFEALSGVVGGFFFFFFVGFFFFFLGVFDIPHLPKWCNTRTVSRLFSPGSRS